MQVVISRFKEEHYSSAYGSRPGTVGVFGMVSAGFEQGVVIVECLCFNYGAWKADACCNRSCYRHIGLRYMIAKRS